MSVFAGYTLSHIFADACEIGAVTGCIYLLFAAAIALRFKPEDKPRNSPTVPVTILKPLHGDEPAYTGVWLRFAINPTRDQFKSFLAATIIMIRPLPRFAVSRRHHSTRLLISRLGDLAMAAIVKFVI
jgi:hypothetical protein